MATLSTPEQELSKNLLKQEARRYLVRCRRKRSNEDDVIAAQLIKDLCAQEHLEVEKVTHIGTSITEGYLHIVFDYSDPGHTVATINAYKGKKMRRIFITPEITTYINRRVDNWIQLHKTQGIGFPIKDEIFPPGSTNPHAPQNLIRETGSAVPSRPTPTKEDATI
ncbi:hypothetical protein G7Y89_g11827 [Cudoniella acicularis]|uniref:Uncharacterized protein n=1 Tax=Cudoniella acicularis TaxID=354080 RepID=A0A8H4RBA0_9HELO|nr:hypothetical protein G7Y89_g11827 [Cudoniella acicularis]